MLIWLLNKQSIKLIFSLAKKWYEKFKSGEKKIEYREVKPYWTKRLAKICGQENIESLISGKTTELIFYEPLPACILRLGYTAHNLSASITKIEIVNEKSTDLQIDKPVFAIHLADIKQQTEV